MSFRNLLLMSVALVTLSACSSDEDQAGMDSSMAGMNGAGLNGSEMGGAPVNGVVPGTQQDLVVNVGDRVFFGYDQSDLSAEARSTLDRQASWMKQYPNVMVTIEGHADERGTREYNLALGERRAASVRSYLMSLGVDASRVNTISYGKERPAVPESTAAAWSQNRRGVTVVN
ncbi:MAG TPA: peptidoglycan-associated lipoprotein Pal [Alphaproteobacteria bacterium]|nr:peptidoglycan-associated lipoprotein Pal [Alphaproteobacteria bacterium]HNS43653.1 peptidoglycan-associated lipoprotein Pal [Alphaproteobacteria bacterium]